MSRRHHRTVIRREHPHHVRIRRALALILPLVAIAAAFFYGQYRAQNAAVPLDTAADELRGRVLDLETQLEVDAQALAELRDELADSRGTIDELERELAFYREVMAPEEVARGVVLRQPRLRPGASPGQWHYQLVAQQGGRSRTVHKGELFFTVHGQVAGQPQSFTLNEVDTSLELPGLDLSFRYFQRYEGQLQLPPGFEPQEVQLVAVITRPADETLESRYAWREITADSVMPNPEMTE